MAQRGEHARAMVLREVAQRGEIAVIVMIVAEQHEVDARQGVQRDAGGMHAVRADPGKRTDAVGENGIDEDVRRRSLQEKRGVTDPRGDDALGGRLRQERRRIDRDVFRPAGGAARELPFQHVEQAASGAFTGIEKSFPVEVVGRRQ